jgi:SAM-dependent methyltransferase
MRGKVSIARMSDYLLGHREAEWQRLDQQHALWKESLLQPIRELGLGDGAAILEVGCGPGALLADLAALGSGRVVGLERDPEAAAEARARLGDRAEVTVGDLYHADLGGPWDLVVARWVFSFLPDPARALERLWQATRAGGAVVVQDYDHDGLGVWPQHAAIDRVIEAFRAAYRARGGDLWIGAKLPQHFAALGARAELYPAIRAGAVDAPVWQWVERFLFDHVDTVVAGGHLTPGQRDELAAAWQRVRREPGAVLFSPIQVTVVARRG